MQVTFLDGANLAAGEEVAKVEALAKAWVVEGAHKSQSSTMLMPQQI